MEDKGGDILDGRLVGDRTHRLGLVDLCRDNVCLTGKDRLALEVDALCVHITKSE